MRAADRDSAIRAAIQWVREGEDARPYIADDFLDEHLTREERRALAHLANAVERVERLRVRSRRGGR